MGEVLRRHRRLWTTRATDGELAALMLRTPSTDKGPPASAVSVLTLAKHLSCGFVSGETLARDCLGRELVISVHAGARCLDGEYGASHRALAGSVHFFNVRGPKWTLVGRVMTVAAVLAGISAEVLLFAYVRDMRSCEEVVVLHVFWARGATPPRCIWSFDSSSGAGAWGLRKRMPSALSFGSEFVREGLLALPARAWSYAAAAVIRIGRACVCFIQGLVPRCAKVCSWKALRWRARFVIGMVAPRDIRFGY